MPTGKTNTPSSPAILPSKPLSFPSQHYKMVANNMFEFELLNQHEVRLMGRKYLFSGTELFTIRDRESDADYQPNEAWTFQAWQGEPVKNPFVLGQFRRLLAARDEQQMQGLFATLRNFVTETREIHMDRWEYAIRQAVEDFPLGFSLGDLVFPVSMILGADSEEAALKGKTYHPYTGKPIDSVQGWIATWVEERSPDSRQRYFCAGKRCTQTNKPLLFVNDGLFAANTANAWQPYKYVRGSRWFYDPAKARDRIQPTEEVLEAAAALYKKQGMRGAKVRTAVTVDRVGTERYLSTQGFLTGTVGAIAAIAFMNA